MGGRRLTREETRPAPYWIPITQPTEITNLIYPATTEVCKRIVREHKIDLIENRAYVQFTQGIPSEAATGGLTHDAPCAIYVDIAELMRQGQVFYLAPNGVILSTAVDLTGTKIRIWHARHGPELDQHNPLPQPQAAKGRRRGKGKGKGKSERRVIESYGGMG